ncbi:tetratricopeptide repeat protein [Marinospirillum alkaliphilum]|uniref:Tetratricopeptide repeat-containing protein n=1 Tax=Marinospirillum alkaliphilum DSM 21637 TaxID=1122209 RepID=A0A1K1YZ33_9GAMM|nr:tetratricopeptide repeat protein [Marinospirillum alkaliphilum]SFX66612.1 Tetratricopeptide repeat-containing protein [Marinospirillum alkaliphilum DSM 21637]
MQSLRPLQWLYRPFMALPLTLLLIACSTTPEPRPAETALPPLPIALGARMQQIHPTDSVLPEVEGLNAYLVFHLLAAELAGQRSDLGFALDIYLALTLETQHPLIAERATWIAQFAQQPQAALDAAIIWATGSPDNPDAQRTAAGLLLQQEQYLDAFEHLLRYERLSSESNYTLLAGHLVESNNPVISDLYQLMLAESNQREIPSSDLQLALALLSEELGDAQSTQHHLQQALELEPGNVRALQLQARLLREAGDSQGAEKILRTAINNNPEEVRLWLELARTQLKAGQLTAAEQTFDHIISLQPDNPQIRLALARIQIETGQYTAARATLEQLTDHPLLSDQVWLHLGQLAERDNEPDVALDHYAQVTAGQPLLDATRASVRLLLDRNQWMSALALLDKRRQQAPELNIQLTLLGEQLLRQQGDYRSALDWIDGGRALLPEYQDSPQLLYSRAMLNYQMNDLAEMEIDLRLLLEIEPNSAMALNALGYTLVDRTDRINEGLLLIQKAHALDSEAPEILDSLGWALFRLGRHEEAREYLEEAYARLPDEEIAAHLAETLWELGHRDEALQLLGRHLQSDQPTPNINRLLERRPDIRPK